MKYGINRNRICMVCQAKWASEFPIAVRHLIPDVEELNPACAVVSPPSYASRGAAHIPHRQYFQDLCVFELALKTAPGISIFSNAGCHRIGLKFNS
ncbi:MAG: hypothetical protein ACN4F8_11255 [Hydrogenophaga sp.]